MTDLEARFYEERDRRTYQYGGQADALGRPVRIVVGEDAAATRGGHIAALALMNLVARCHRIVAVDAPEVPLLAKPLVASGGLRSSMVATARAINPFIGLADPGRLSAFSIGLGERSTGSSLYLGASGPVARVAQQPIAFSPATGVLGGGGAACLGAAALFRAVHGFEVEPHGIDLWTLGAELSGAVPVESRIDVGNVVLVGAGAVASALAYWVREVGRLGDWIVVDGDVVQLHNTNRCLGLTATDAGGRDGRPSTKADALADLLGIHSFPRWYGEWAGREPLPRFDLILPLANQYGARPAIQALGREILVHATTSPNWTSELHRHIAGRDGCMTCRFGETIDVQFACAEGPVPVVTSHYSEETSRDAALPFLSAMSGLMLTSALLQLQHEGPVISTRLNAHVVHLSTAAAVIRGALWRCSAGCSAVVQPSVRELLNVGSRWTAEDLAAK